MGKLRRADGVGDLCGSVCGVPEGPEGRSSEFLVNFDRRSHSGLKGRLRARGWRPSALTGPIGWWREGDEVGDLCGGGQDIREGPEGRSLDFFGQFWSLRPFVPKGLVEGAGFAYQRPHWAHWLMKGGGRGR